MYYARQIPRGFSNEVMIHGFGTKAERDAWVEDHKDDCNGQSCTRAITAREAQRYIRGSYRDICAGFETEHDTSMTELEASIQRCPLCNAPTVEVKPERKGSMYYKYRCLPGTTKNQAPIGMPGYWCDSCIKKTRP